MSEVVRAFLSVDIEEHVGVTARRPVSHRPTLGMSLSVRPGTYHVEVSVTGLSGNASVRVLDLSGRTVYPGLIEPHLPLSSLSGKGEGKGDEGDGGGEEQPPAGPYHPVARVRAETRVAELLRFPDKQRERWREAGFTTLHVAPDRGIFRGRGAVLNTGSGRLNDLLLLSGSSHHLIFDSS